MMTKRRWVNVALMAAASAVVFGTGKDAAAGDEIVNFAGYVCSVSMVSNDSETSRPSITLYAAPGCTGAYLGLAYVGRQETTQAQMYQVDRMTNALVAASTTDARINGTWRVITWQPYFEPSVLSRSIHTLTVNSN
jgi:hypothetical protein